MCLFESELGSEKSDSLNTRLLKTGVLNLYGSDVACSTVSSSPQGFPQVWKFRSDTAPLLPNLRTMGSPGVQSQHARPGGGSTGPQGPSAVHRGQEGVVLGPQDLIPGHRGCRQC